MSTDINEKTKVPLYDVLIVAVFLVSVVAWLTRVSATTFDTKERVDKIEKAVMETRDIVIEMRAEQKKQKPKE